MLQKPATEGREENVGLQYKRTTWDRKFPPMGTCMVAARMHSSMVGVRCGRAYKREGHSTGVTQKNADVRGAGLYVLARGVGWVRGVK
jgi:hypothetical protein